MNPGGIIIIITNPKRESSLVVNDLNKLITASTFIVIHPRKKGYNEYNCSFSLYVMNVQERR